MAEHFFVIPLALLIAGLLITAIFLNVRFYREKKAFRQKMDSMRLILRQLGGKNVSQSERIRIAESGEANLSSQNAVLAQDIAGMNLNLFEMLSENGLLK